jgi:hypothetical protein
MIMILARESGDLLLDVRAFRAGAPIALTCRKGFNPGQGRALSEQRGPSGAA